MNDELKKLATMISDKIAQLEHYRDRDCQLEHARTIAEGRIMQANQIAFWVSAISHKNQDAAE